MVHGKLLVISGPSGAGKSTAIQGVRALHPDMYFSVSATTRKMREGDENGVTYWFKTREEFLDMVEQNAFYEYAQYTENFYGTPREPVESRLNQGVDVIMDIDVQGAMQIREKCEDAVLIFLAPPSEEVLEQRLRGRGDTAESDMKRRLEEAKRECTYADKYDYIVISDTPERTVNDINSILTAEKLRASRRTELL